MFKKKISSNVVILGIVSLFNDFSSEMVYPLIPLFLTSLGAPIAIIGLIEGIAELSASFFKVFFGVLSDRIHKRKIFVGGGYFFTTSAKVIIGLSYHWFFALFGRIVDRIGKGMRTSPRDALIAESSARQRYGTSFGLHRALDTVGAIAGPLVAMGLLAFFGNNIRPIFFIASIFGLISVVLVVWLVKEPSIKKETFLSFHISQTLTTPFKYFLFASALFALGNSSNVFLILKAKALGMSTMTITFMYAVYNAVYASCSFVAGIVSDKIGAKKVLAAGYFLFAGLYVLFGLNSSFLGLWLLFMCYGVYMALTDGVSSAYISHIVQHKALASAFGLHQALTGICTFFASLLAGVLWSQVGMNTPFFVGAFFAAIAAILFCVMPGRK